MIYSFSKRSTVLLNKILIIQLFVTKDNFGPNNFTVPKVYAFYIYTHLATLYFMGELQSIYIRRLCPILPRRKCTLDRVSRYRFSHTCVATCTLVSRVRKRSMKLIVALPLAVKTHNPFAIKTVYKML